MGRKIEWVDQSVKGFGLWSLAFDTYPLIALTRHKGRRPKAQGHLASPDRFTHNRRQRIILQNLVALEFTVEVATKHCVS
jgi:hypothetical protein